LQGESQDNAERLAPPADEILEPVPTGRGQPKRSREEILKEEAENRAAFERANNARRIAAPDLRVARSRREVQRVYSRFLPELKLDVATEAKLKALLAERTSTASDTNEIARRQRLSPDAREQLIKTAQAEVDRDIQSLLSPTAYVQVREVMELQPVLSQLENSYCLDMAYAGAPMSSAQTIELARLVAVYMRGHNPELHAKRTTISNNQAGTSVLDETVLLKAAAFLDAEQLALLQKNLVTATKAAVAGAAPGAAPSQVR
jgi:hypothetical protein